MSSEKRKIEPLEPEVEQAAKAVLDAAFKVHSALGPGLLESIYEACLTYEITKSGRQIRTQVVVPIKYEEVHIEAGLRLDMLVDNSVIVEIKSVKNLQPIHKAQLLTYLKLAEKRLGLLINFNVTHLREGIKRVIL